MQGYSILEKFDKAKTLLFVIKLKKTFFGRILSTLTTLVGIVCASDSQKLPISRKYLVGLAHSHLLLHAPIPVLVFYPVKTLRPIHTSTSLQGLARFLDVTL